jgi:hypothetical protein
MYSIHVTFGNLGFVTMVDAATVDDANIVAMELAEKEFGPNLNGITYEIEEVK